MTFPIRKARYIEPDRTRRIHDLTDDSGRYDAGRYLVIEDPPVYEVDPVTRQATTRLMQFKIVGGSEL